MLVINIMFFSSVKSARAIHLINSRLLQASALYVMQQEKLSTGFHSTYVLISCIDTFVDGIIDPDIKPLKSAVLDSCVTLVFFFLDSCVT